MNYKVLPVLLLFLCGGEMDFTSKKIYREEEEKERVEENK